MCDEVNVQVLEPGHDVRKVTGRQRSIQATAYKRGRSNRKITMSNIDQPASITTNKNNIRRTLNVHKSNREEANGYFRKFRHPPPIQRQQENVELAHKKQNVTLRAYISGYFEVNILVYGSRFYQGGFAPSGSVRTLPLSSSHVYGISPPFGSEDQPRPITDRKSNSHRLRGTRNDPSPAPRSASPRPSPRTPSPCTGIGP